MEFRSAEHGAPDHFLIHISDTHFNNASEGPLYGTGDPRARLGSLLECITEYGIAPEAMIFSGDLTDRGEESAYRDLRAMVEHAACDLDCKIVWAPGNHDNRASFRTHLLHTPPSEEPIDCVEYVGGLRLIVLDSSVPGEHYGYVDDAQLLWLRNELETPALEGSILVMHHPPIPSIQEAAREVELRATARLAEVIRGSDIRSIISGHVHYPTFSTFAGIPVSVATSSCYTQDLFTPHRGTRGRDAFQGINFVHVYKETVMHTVVMDRSGQTVGRYLKGHSDG